MGHAYPEFLGDDEGDAPAHAFFIGQRAVEQGLRGEVAGDGEAVLFTDGDEFLRGAGLGDAEGFAGPADHDHADGDAVAVHETVLRAALDGVADGVAEVQVAADTGVELIVRDIVRFDLHAFGDHVGDVRPDSVRALREDLKEAGALEHSVLDALGTAVMEDDVRQMLR